MQILITGGAGFIGSHLADALLEAGHQVRALDNLSPQVHGPGATRPAYLSPDVDLRVGDVRDSAMVQRALEGVDAVYHFAATVGVGQSMYEIARYTDVNNRGTAVLLEALVQKPVQRLVVASSMSLYGEGRYQRHDGTACDEAARPLERLKQGRWEPVDRDGGPLLPVPTPEEKRPALSSVYALSKFDQEQLCMIVGRAYGIPTVALRFFNVYGTRQALSNPYTGVLAIFASRLLNGRPPMLFEDGRQRRDFVAVADIVQACQLALTAEGAPGRAFNVGSGVSHSVVEVARALQQALATGLDIEPSGQHRVGDVRHCFADISLARQVLGYQPAVTLSSGLQALTGWLQEQTADDRVAEAGRELRARGLTLDAARAG